MSIFTYSWLGVNSEGESTSPPLSIAWGGHSVKSGGETPCFQVFRGIDTLHIGLFVFWDKEELFTILERAKFDCQADDYKNHPLKLKDFENFIVYPSGKKGGYGWHISTADIHVFFSRHDPRGTTPNVFVEIGSVSCWDRGVFDVLKALEHLFMLYGGEVIKTSVNRFDPAVDCVGLDIQETQIFDREKWVKQALTFDLRGEGRKFSNASFGFSKTSVCGLRIYDKALELKNDPAKRAFFHDLWGISIEDNVPVTRVEFQLRKDILKELSSVKFEDLAQNLQGIWEYLTTKWFRLCKKVDRQNIKNAKNTKFWDIITNIKWTDKVIHLERVAKRAKKVIQPLVDQAAGLAISIAAYLGQTAEEINQIVDTLAISVKQKLTKDYETRNTDYMNKFLVRQSEAWDACYDSLIC
ncbi:MAG: hypothetical protein KQI78_25330 [Deltaproteobacteria bacterium]|nr:hypothetical protein [Deltaproteobacteria bacterium]